MLVKFSSQIRFSCFSSGSFFIINLYKVSVEMSAGLTFKLFKFTEKQWWNKPLSVCSSDLRLLSLLFSCVFSDLRSATILAHSWTLTRFLARLFLTDSLFFSLFFRYSSDSFSFKCFIDLCTRNVLAQGGCNNEHIIDFSFSVLLLNENFYFIKITTLLYSLFLYFINDHFFLLTMMLSLYISIFNEHILEFT